MERELALDRLCREGAFMVAPLYAESIARAFDTDLARIGLEPKLTVELARETLGPLVRDAAVRIHQEHRDDKAVFVFELGAKLGVFFGLYANIDHAMQTPYHKTSDTCRFIACRAAVRLARLFDGSGGVARLRERNPWLEERLFTEKPYTGTGQRLPFQRPRRDA